MPHGARALAAHCAFAIATPAEVTGQDFGLETLHLGVVKAALGGDGVGPRTVPRTKSCLLSGPTLRLPGPARSARAFQGWRRNTQFCGVSST
jgi:hypothetical protein